MTTGVWWVFSLRGPAPQLTSPGSYNFGLKGADTGGYDTMEISFSVELDETKTDGSQLFSVTKNV